MKTLFKKIIKGLLVVIILSILTYQFIQVGQLQEQIIIANNYYSSEIKYIYGQYNQILKNERELIAISKSTQDATKKNIDKLLKLINNNYTEIMKSTSMDVFTIKKILNSDVFVEGALGQGAGTVIKKTEDSMYVLSCYHVIDDIIELNDRGIDAEARVGYSKYNTTENVVGLVVYKAEIIKADKDIDLVLLKVKALDDELVAVDLAQEEPNKGDLVYSVGNPLGLLRTISKGIIANKAEGFYFCDNTTTYGNSGGGLYNYKGELIGVPSNVMGYEAGEGTFVPESGLGLSRDISTIKKFLNGVEY